MRRRLLVVAPCLAEMVRCAGGYVFDQVMEGWDVTVLTSGLADRRPLRILGARGCDLDTALASPVRGPRPFAVAAGAEPYAADPRVRHLVDAALEGGRVELRLWGAAPAVGTDPVLHRLTVAARAFKAQALAAVSAEADPGEATEVFGRAALLRA